MAVILILSSSCSLLLLSNLARDAEEDASDLADANNSDVPFENVLEGEDSEPTQNNGSNAEANNDADGNNGAGSIRTYDVNEAREIAQAWLRDHPVYEPNILDRGYDEETVFGREYYRFFLIEPHMYWFNILVPKEPGELIMMLIEDGMHGGVSYEPLDDWYNRFYSDSSSSAPSASSAVESLWGAIWNAENYGEVVILYIYWDNGSQTTFYNEYFDGWRMISRSDGKTSSVYPDYRFRDATVEIRFPTTQRVYYLYDDNTGVFGNESFWWSHEQP